ncbi:MAG: TIGR01777 family protein [Actinobacteria bacterium]|nr:TIGR01777 family protein [Actinomycetota bacterium]
MAKYAITGASGLIGSALAKALEERGDSVLRIGRGSNENTDIEWDPSRAILDASDLDGLDGLVHLAGESIEGRWSKRKKERILNSRILGTSLLAAKISELDNPPKVVVSSSAIGFYGNRGDEILSEKSVSGSGFLAEVCKKWELEATAIESPKTRLVIARTGIVCTPMGGALPKILQTLKFFVGGPLGSGKQWWSWISLEDEIRALLHLLDSDVDGAVNLVAPEPVTNKSFVKIFGKQMSRPSFLVAPSLALRLLLGEMADGLLLASARVKPDALTESGFVFKHSNLDSAARELTDSHE